MTDMKIATNEEIETKINNKTSIILDVREPAEYALKHIPNSTHIPLGELSSRLDEIDKNKTVYVICRTGSRSQYAVNFMINEGITDIYNVLPGMINWTGPSESNF